MRNESDNLIVSPLTNPACLAALASDAAVDGKRMVARFIEEWADQTNNFSLPGERAYIAIVANHAVGVCGLNIDPFAKDPTVGRVRRLYVAVSHRRHGIGSALMNRLMSDARPGFQTLHLRTHDAEASAFYQAIGFAPVQNDHECTHKMFL